MPVYRGVWTIDHPSLGGTGTNTWHCRITSSAGSPDEKPALNGLNVALGQFYTAIEDIYAGGAHLHFNGEWTQIDVPEPRIVAADTNDVVVGGTTDALPPATCIVVGWRTEAATRRGRGRTFLGPLRTSVNQSNGTPLETVRAEVETAAADFIDQFDGLDGSAFGIWSEADSVLRDIVDGRVRNEFAVLRSRRD